MIHGLLALLCHDPVQKWWVCPNCGWSNQSCQRHDLSPSCRCGQRRPDNVGVITATPPQPQLFVPQPQTSFVPQQTSFVPQQQIITTTTTQFVPQIPPQLFVQNVSDQRIVASSSSQSQQQQPQCPYVPCNSTSSVPVIWRNTANQLKVPIQVCPQVTATLGHPFALMSERERYLRAESGVIENNRGVQGPNNALVEIRLMLVNARCQPLQIAIRFRDQNQRYLLFRSTGAHVLKFADDGVTTVPRTHNVVGRTATGGYAADESYVHTGCLSFFSQDTTALDEPRLTTAENYQDHHDGE